MNDHRKASPHPFDQLTPDFITSRVESLGYVTDGRLFALNSYENRVYQVGIEDDTPVIAKFYRPGRWNRAAIEEEHAFALELSSAEIPVVAPMTFNGHTLHEATPFYFAVYPRQGGRWPELQTAEDRAWMGRFIGRIHAIGRRGRFQHRVRINIDAWAADSREYLLDQRWIPDHLMDAYESITEDLLEYMRQRWQVIAATQLRLHGDCHPGNILWTDQGPHFVDFDDCMMGPAVQDIWMLLSGPHTERAQQLHEILDGYSQFADFDPAELALIEILRTLRLMHYAAWLARRWQDPAFPKAFPWFAENKFWEQHVLDLREQLAALDEDTLL
ncbi:MAG: serine/threonine protein kinase [Steroidobacter sp.]